MVIICKKEKGILSITVIDINRMYGIVKKVKKSKKVRVNQ